MSQYSDIVDLAKTNGINPYGQRGKKNVVQLVQELLSSGAEIPEHLLPEAFQKKEAEEAPQPLSVGDDELQEKQKRADELVARAKQRKKWSPIGKPDILKVRGKDPRFHYRFIDRNPERIHEVRDRGFEFCDANTGIPGAVVNHETIQDGKPIDGVRGVKRDLVLMATPKDPYLGLREEEAKKRRESALKAISPKTQTARAQAEYGPKANVHGQIIIE